MPAEGVHEPGQLVVGEGEELRATRLRNQDRRGASRVAPRGSAGPLLVVLLRAAGPDQSKRRAKRGWRAVWVTATYATFSQAWYGTGDELQHPELLQRPLAVEEVHHREQCPCAERVAPSGRHRLAACSATNPSWSEPPSRRGGQLAMTLDTGPTAPLPWSRSIVLMSDVHLRRIPFLVTGRSRSPRPGWGPVLLGATPRRSWHDPAHTVGHGTLAADQSSRSSGRGLEHVVDIRTTRGAATTRTTPARRWSVAPGGGCLLHLAARPRRPAPSGGWVAPPRPAPRRVPGLRGPHGDGDVPAGASELLRWRRRAGHGAVQRVGVVAVPPPPARRPHPADGAVEVLHLMTTAAAPSTSDRRRAGVRWWSRLRRGVTARLDLS